MHTIRTTAPAVVRPTIRNLDSTPADRVAAAAHRSRRLLSAWAERRLLGAPDPGRVPATPHRELPLPWA